MCEIDESLFDLLPRIVVATLWCIRGHELPQALQSGFIHSATKVILDLNLKDEKGCGVEGIIDVAMPLVVTLLPACILR